MEQKKLTPQQKELLIITARNLRAKRELKERNRVRIENQKNIPQSEDKYS